MTPFQKHWVQLSIKHDLKIDVPFTLEFPDGTKIDVDILLHGYGAKKGMLLISDFSKIRDRMNEIIEMGYGFSCLSEPKEENIGSDECLQEMLDDWGNIK